MKKTKNKKTKRNFLISCLFALSTFVAGQGITINTDIYGVNAWFINVHEANASLFGSHFESQLAAVKASGCKMVRIGGIAPNWDQLYDFDANSLAISTPVDRLEHLIGKIRDAGMDVIIQVSYAPPTLCPNYVPQSGYSPLAAHTLQQQATIAANLVEHLNNVLGLNVLYWSVANEPDLSLGTCTDPHGFGLSAETDAPTIAEYMKVFSTAMKNKHKYIKIIGPELASFSTDVNGHKMLAALISDPADPNNSNTSIMGKIGTGNNAQGEYFVDIISVHYYPSSGDLAQVQDNPSHSTSGIGAKISCTGITLREGLVELITGAGRDISNCRIAFTEFNLDNFTSKDESTHFTDVIEEWDSRSFAGGQWLCEVYAEALKQHSGGTPWVQFMTLWSVKEGGCEKSGSSRPFGYISNCTGKKRPMYYHYQMMAEHFKGKFFTAAISNAGSSKIKAWAAQSDDRIAVMIMNQDANGSKPFKVRLNSSIAAGSGLDILIDIPDALSTAEYVSSTDLANQSTVLLIFTCKGNFSERRDYTITHASASADTGPEQIETGVALIGAQVVPPNAPEDIPFETGDDQLFKFGPSNFSFEWLQPGPCAPVMSTNDGRDVIFTNCFSDRVSTYTYIATNPEGCTVKQEISVDDVIVTPLPSSGIDANVGTGVSNCGADNGSATVYCSNCVNATYSWDGGPITSSASKSGLSPGAHKVKVFTGVSEIELKYGIPITGTRPVISAGPDFSTKRLCNAKLEAVPLIQGATYEWFSGSSTVPFTNTRVTYITQWSGEKFRVKVTDVNGCTNEDEVYVNRHGFACLPSGWMAQIPCDPQFNSTYRSASTISTETLTESQTIEKNMYLDKILVVPEGVTLTVQNCIVAFSPSAHIVLNPGGGLVLETTYFVPCGVGFYPYVTTTGGGTNSTLIVKNSAFEGRDVAFELNKDGDGVFDANTFSRCSTCIDMDGYNDFSFTNNTFYEVGTAIRSKALSGTIHAEIQSNNFILTSTGINITEGDHSMLAIACNTLDYSEYGIKSEGIMQDFGDATTSSGNYFISNSSNVNHQLHHTGNPIRYFCGPNHPFSLSGAEGCRVTTTVSLHDPDCPEPVNYREAPQKKEIPVLATLLKAYPNPTPDKINIICVLPAENSSGTLSLFEIGSGKVLQQVDVRKGSQELTFDLSKYESAVFGALLQTNSGERLYIKILKAY